MNCMTRSRLLTAFTFAGIAFAQPAATPPAIDVASIKPSDPGLTPMNNHFCADRFTLIGYAAESLIQDAFRVKDYQVFGAPEWTRSERWTLEVKTTGPSNYGQKLELLQPLLADRFQLGVAILERRTTSAESVI